MKAAKADKSVIDAAVAQLLDLKSRLCVAEGKDPKEMNPPTKSKKSTAKK